MAKLDVKVEIDHGELSKQGKSHANQAIGIMEKRRLRKPGKRLGRAWWRKFVKNTLSDPFHRKGTDVRFLSWGMDCYIHGCLRNMVFDSNLCILCTAFLQKLYCARVSHNIVLKMADLSILMEPTLLLEKGSATVSYNAFGWCWYLNVASMLAA